MRRRLEEERKKQAEAQGEHFEPEPAYVAFDADPETPTGTNDGEHSE